MKARAPFLAAGHVFDVWLGISAHKTGLWISRQQCKGGDMTCEASLAQRNAGPTCSMLSPLRDGKSSQLVEASKNVGLLLAPC